MTIYIKSFRILLYFPLHIWCGCSAVTSVNTTNWPLQRNSFLGNFISSISHTPFIVLFIHSIMYHWRCCLQPKQMRASLNNTLKISFLKGLLRHDHCGGRKKGKKKKNENWSIRSFIINRGHFTSFSKIYLKKKTRMKQGAVSTQLISISFLNNLKCQLDATR